MPLAARLYLCILLVVLIPLFMLTRSVGALQPTTALHTHLDPTRLEVIRDSFVIIANGQEIGAQRYEITRLPTGWQFLDAVTLGSDVQQESRIQTDSMLRERQLEQTGRMKARPMAISLRLSDTRVEGEALTPASGPVAVRIDREIPPGTVDDNAVVPLLAAMRWHPSLDIRFPVLSSGKGTVAIYRLRVIGPDTTTVRAGHFDTWRAELDGSGAGMILHVTRQTPHRLVRLSIRNTPMDMQRVH